MNIEESREYCLSFEGVTEKTPFGKFARRYESILVFYVAGHMFCFFDMDDFNFVDVRSTPDEIKEIRQNKNSVSTPINRSLKYWIQLDFNGDVSDEEIRGYVSRAYEIVKNLYSKKS